MILAKASLRAVIWLQFHCFSSPSHLIPSIKSRVLILLYLFTDDIILSDPSFMGESFPTQLLTKSPLLGLCVLFCMFQEISKTSGSVSWQMPLKVKASFHGLNASLGSHVHLIFGLNILYYLLSCQLIYAFTKNE